MSRAEAPGAVAEVRAAATALVSAFGEGRVDDYFDAFAQDATFVFHPERARVESREAYRRLWDGWARDDGFRGWLAVHEHLSPRPD